MIVESEKSQDQVQSKSEGLGSRRAGGISSSLSPTLKAEEDQCPSSKTGRERKQIVPTSAFFYSLPAFSELYKTHTHWEGQLVLSVGKLTTCQLASFRTS